MPLENYLSEIFSFIAGLAGGALLTVTITKTVSRKSVGRSGTMVDQSGSRVRGDQIGVKFGPNDKSI